MTEKLSDKYKLSDYLINLEKRGRKEIDKNIYIIHKHIHTYHAKFPAEIAHHIYFLNKYPYFLLSLLFLNKYDFQLYMMDHI